MELIQTQKHLTKLKENYLKFKDSKNTKDINYTNNLSLLISELESIISFFNTNSN